MTPVKLKTVACPRCGKESEWSRANPYRPFCSERCQLIDLGAWATEAYRVPAQEAEKPPSTDPAG